MDKMKEMTQMLSAQPNVDIIIPTIDNGEVFSRCLKSLLMFTSEQFRLVIVNNGGKTLARPENYPHLKIIDLPENRGWMGGINEGLRWCLDNSSAEYVLFLNDDVQILDHDYAWLSKMIMSFQLAGNIGAVGPVSNAVMGLQLISHIGMPPNLESTRISGMCFLTKKDVIRKVGMLDESLPGGDDLDMSIRIRNAGYRLCICRRTFVLHLYANTGRRIFGDYWDSKEHSDKINNALIKKHGFKEWFYCVNDFFDTNEEPIKYEKLEEDFVLKNLNGELEHGKVLDLGCGGKKIHPNVIGVDFRPNGQKGVGSNVYCASAGDVACDVTDLKIFDDCSVDAVIAKHLLEHIHDTPKAIREWGRVLKPGGKLIILVPDWRFCEAMTCDPTHVHAFVPESLNSIINAVGGFEIVNQENMKCPAYVFCTTLKKV